MEHLTQTFHDLVIHFGYAGLFIVMMLGNIGAPAGTEIVMPTAGALAAQGHLPGLGPIPGWVVAGFIGTVAEVCGASLLYAIGFYGGEPFIERYGKYVGFKTKQLATVHGFYARYGAQTVFWCRFIPFVRGVASFPAGVARMPKRWFVGYTALGSIIFCFGLALLGNAAGRHVDQVTANLHKIAIAAVALVVVAAIAGFFVWRARAARGKSAPGDAAERV